MTECLYNIIIIIYIHIFYMNRFQLFFAALEKTTSCRYDGKVVHRRRSGRAIAVKGLITSVGYSSSRMALIARHRARRWWTV